MSERLCKRCGQPFEQYRTTQNLCPDCQYKKSAATKKERRVIIKHRGKRTREWLDVDRPKWFKNHPPSHEGYYECYLGISPLCLKFMRKNETTLDHVKARSTDPGKRRKQQNFKPACYPCNGLKGSATLARIKKLYPNSKVAKG